jgi:hypothetical protein
LFRESEGDMDFVTRWTGWEALFIHGLTGALFAAISAFFLYRLALSAPPVLALALPFTAFCAWGWWAEAVVLVRATAWRRQSIDRRGGAPDAGLH